ncbi:MAG: efflux RND transporter permease subunit [Campylobacteraceae bacterium]|jgi:Cu(I)/Ag(I) efflux system membrane protein CusA/SilA|nr:efflux RND transporter permease subunit [Campylobacteraceae bacterium]
MIEYVIKASIKNRFLVMICLVFLSVFGVWSLKNTPIDALPDLSDIQVIVRTSYPSQSPQIVEAQITYPLSTLMLSVPEAKTVRGFSSFGESFIYVIFQDGTDLYWARSRVLEYLNQAKLPEGVTPQIGPDTAGTGWIYEYVLVDKTNRYDLSELRSLQDWFLKFELQTVPNVAEVASVGGVVKEYQIVVDPLKLANYGILLSDIKRAVGMSNQEMGGSVVELAEAEYMVRSSGYLSSLKDFDNIVLKTYENGVSVYLKDVARISEGAQMRRGIGEFNGEGESAGGIVLIRSSKNAKETITAVKEKLRVLSSSLPEGVEIVTVYDRSELINRAIENLTSKLIEEFIIIALVCILFLRHARSALVAIISLPLGVLCAFIIIYFQGINANIMSLGGIAIAIGAMVDAAVVMVENTHKKIEKYQPASSRERWELITKSSIEVGPALFISLLIITLSFIPVFTLEGEEGRMFAPLAFTKTYSMAAAALLAITAIPIFMGYCIKGKIPKEDENPLNNFLIKAYRPALNYVLKYPKMTIFIAILALSTVILPIKNMGGEFLPRIDEGDLLYMPSTLPSISPSEAAKLLQRSDKLIKTLPEVESVFGKAGRAESATDPAPMSMIETVIKLKPKSQWREGMNIDGIIKELDESVRFPGVANLWVFPIRSRIDMLSTGVKSPIGVRVSGSDLEEIDRAAEQIQDISKRVSGVSSALSEKLTGGRYIDINVKREQASRYAMNIDDVQLFVSSAIGGETVGQSIEGTARYPINIRYPQSYRDSVENLKKLPILTPKGEQITLGDVADIKISSGAPMLKSENARLSAWVYIDARDRDLAGVVEDLKTLVEKEVKISGVSISYTGQFELLQRANQKLKLMVPLTLGVIFVLLYIAFKRLCEALLIIFTIPFALIGGFWFLYLQGFHFSIAAGTGFIALSGLAAEFGVVMLIYLKQALADKPAQISEKELDEALYQGAVLRVRPKAMTVTVVVAGLLPILFGHGAGSEVMKAIAAPMVGGMITAPLLSMFIIPAAYKLLKTANLYVIPARAKSFRRKRYLRGTRESKKE